MDITAHNIRTPRTARYYSAGELNSNTKIIWFVIHGFGQLAGDFIKQFEYLVNRETVVIAPEALSRSYSGNKIGASWMTKEDRENEIADYIEYLDNLFAEVSQKMPDSPLVNIVGFSQGVHTAVRWFSQGKYSFDKLILCSADFPKDAKLDMLKDMLSGSKMYYMCGDKDEYVTQEVFIAGKKILAENKIDFQSFWFEGKHVVNHDIIKQIAAEYP